MLTEVPPRHGQPWTDAEDAHLRHHINRWSGNKPRGGANSARLRYLAWKHQRNVNAIMARIRQKFDFATVLGWSEASWNAAAKPMRWAEDAKPPVFAQGKPIITGMFHDAIIIDDPAANYLYPYQKRIMDAMLGKNDAADAMHYALSPWFVRNRLTPQPKAFWMCMAERGTHSPKHRHETEALAVAEAERLSRMLGQKVFVVKAITSVERTPPKPEPEFIRTKLL